MNLDPTHGRDHSCRLILDSLTALSDARKERFTVLINVQVGDDQIRRGKSNRNILAVGLLADHALNVNNVLQTVDGGDAALTALLGAPGDGDGIVDTKGNGANL